jgi:uncharacterized protein YacL
MCSQKATNWKKQHIENIRRLALWTFLWLITVTLASHGPALFWGNDKASSILAIGLNVITGCRMIWANKIQLQGLDELQQRVQLEAMGITLGIGLVLGLAYSSLHTANIIAGNAEISHLVMIMAITYLVCTLIGLRRYQ